MKTLEKMNEMDLFPNYVKKLGIGLMLLGFIPAAIAKFRNTSFIIAHQQTFYIITMNLFILGLFCIAWAKDKKEDERSIHIRMRSISWTFMFAIFYIISGPIIELMFGGGMFSLSGQQVVVTMLIVYISMYYIQKNGKINAKYNKG